jgi:hypothetical protein
MYIVFYYYTDELRDSEIWNNKVLVMKLSDNYLKTKFENSTTYQFKNEFNDVEYFNKVTKLKSDLRCRV